MEEDCDRAGPPVFTFVQHLLKTAWDLRQHVFKGSASQLVSVSENYDEKPEIHVILIVRKVRHTHGKK